MTTLIIGPYAKAAFAIYLRAKDEGWDWRRTKRELRRIGKGGREYHKRLLTSQTDQPNLSA